MPVARLEIPRLNLSVTILEGVSDATLDLAPGHVPKTALPGTTGNVGIAAHRHTHFRPLKGIRNGDVIRVRTLEGDFEYTVEWTRVVKPQAVEVLAPTDAPSLTLITCYPFNYVGSAPTRLIVRARQLTSETL
jgi:sortase A